MANNDLQIRVGISVEESAAMATKFKEKLSELQGIIDNEKVNVGVQFDTKGADAAKESVKKVQNELTTTIDVSNRARQSFETLSNSLMKRFGKDGANVQILSSGQEGAIDRFTVKVTDSENHVVQYKYALNQLSSEFELLDKSMKTNNTRFTIEEMNKLKNAIEVAKSGLEGLKVKYAEAFNEPAAIAAMGKFENFLWGIGNRKSGDLSEAISKISLKTRELKDALSSVADDQSIANALQNQQVKADQMMESYTTKFKNLSNEYAEIFNRPSVQDAANKLKENLEMVYNISDAKVFSMLMKEMDSDFKELTSSVKALESARIADIEAQKTQIAEQEQLWKLLHESSLNPTNNLGISSRSKAQDGEYIREHKAMQEQLLADEEAFNRRMETSYKMAHAVYIKDQQRMWAELLAIRDEAEAKALQQQEAAARLQEQVAERANKINQSSSVKATNAEMDRYNQKLMQTDELYVRLSEKANIFGKIGVSDADLQKIETLRTRIFELTTNTNLPTFDQELKAVEADLRGLSVTSTTTGESMGGLNRFLTSVQQGFGMFLGGGGIMGVTLALQKAFDAIKEFDTATVDMIKVTDASGDSLERLKSAAMDIGQEMGVQAKDVMASMAEFGRITKNAGEIQNLSRVATMAANVTDMSAEQSAKALNTTIQSLRLNMGDAGNVLDQFNEIQNNFRTSGVDLSDSIKKVGASAHLAGIQLNELNGMTTALVHNTGITGSEAGTALKTIVSRVYKVGKDGVDDAGQVERALKNVGVAVRDAQGNFRNFTPIMNELHSKWGNLTNAQQEFIAQQVAGTMHYSKFISLMEGWGTAVDASSKALNSAGSAVRENDREMDSFSGRVNQMKGAWTDLLLSMQDSGTLKGVVTSIRDILQGMKDFGGAIGNVVRFGLEFAAVGVTVKGLSSLWSTSVTGIKNIFSAFSDLSTTIGAGILPKFSALRTAFLGAKTAEEQTAVETYGLSTAFQTLQSVGIFAIITGITLAINYFTEMGRKADEVQEKMDSFNRGYADLLKQSSSDYNSGNKAFGAIEALENKISNTKDLDERIKLTNELTQKQKDLAQTFPELVSGYTAEGDAIANDDKKIKDFINSKSQLTVENAKQFGRDNNLNGAFGDLDNAKKKLEEQEDILNKLKNGSKEVMVYYDTMGNRNDIIPDLLSSGELQNKMQILSGNIDKSKASWEAYNTEIKNLVNTIEQLRVQGLDNAQIEQALGISDDTLSRADAMVGSANELTDTFAHARDTASDMGSRVEELTNLQGKLNDKQVDGHQIVSELATSYPDLASKMSHAIDLQYSLNELIEREKEVQEKAYDEMLGDDAAYYENRLRNGNTLHDAFNKLTVLFGDNQAKAYGIDGTNFNNLNQFKAQGLNSLKDSVVNYLKQFVGSNAEAYAQDIRNANNWVDAKNAIINSMNKAADDIANTQLPTGIPSAKDSDRYMQQYKQPISQINQLRHAAAQFQTDFESFAGVIYNGAGNYVAQSIAGRLNNEKVDEGWQGGGQTDAQQRAAEKAANSAAQKEENAATKAANEARRAEEKAARDAQSAAEKATREQTNAAKEAQRAAEKAASDAKREAEEAQRAAEEYQRKRVELEKTADSQISSMRDLLIDALKRKYETLKKAELEPIDKELEIRHKELDRIKNDGKTDEERIVAMRSQLALWEQNDSSYAAEKATELRKNVAELEQNIAISNLEQQKKDINDKYSKLTEETALYKEASDMIAGNQFDQMTQLLKDYGNEWKSVAVLMGQSVSDAIKGQLEQLKASLDYIRMGGAKGASDTLFGSVSATLGRYARGGNVGTWSGDLGRLAMVDSGERVLTDEQNELFQNLIYNILPNLSRIPLNAITNIGKLVDGLTNTGAVGVGQGTVEFNNNYNVVNNTPFDSNKFNNRVEDRIKEQLLAAGVKSAF